MFKLTQISAGFISIDVTSQNETFEIIIDDDNDDLRRFSEFAAWLIAGAYPTVYVSDYKHCRWTYDKDDNFKLHREFDALMRDTLSKISIKIDRFDLITALHRLAKDISFHENFARGFLFFAGGTPEQNKFFDVTDHEWEEGVKAGLFPDDLDSKDAYENRRFIEEFPLTEYEKTTLEEYQNVLLSAFSRA